MWQPCERPVATYAHIHLYTHFNLTHILIRPERQLQLPGTGKLPLTCGVSLPSMPYTEMFIYSVVGCLAVLQWPLLVKWQLSCVSGSDRARRSNRRDGVRGQGGKKSALIAWINHHFISGWYVKLEIIHKAQLCIHKSDDHKLAFNRNDFLPSCIMNS